jgi:hypothetical protein
MTGQNARPTRWTPLIVLAPVVCCGLPLLIAAAGTAAAATGAVALGVVVVAAATGLLLWRKIRD